MTKTKVQGWRSFPVTAAPHEPIDECGPPRMGHSALNEQVWMVSVNFFSLPFFISEILILAASFQETSTHFTWWVVPTVTLTQREVNPFAWWLEDTCNWKKEPRILPHLTHIGEHTFPLILSSKTPNGFYWSCGPCCACLLSSSVVSDSLWPHGL